MDHLSEETPRAPELTADEEAGSSAAPAPDVAALTTSEAVGARLEGTPAVGTPELDVHFARCAVARSRPWLSAPSRPHLSALHAFQLKYADPSRAQELLNLAGTGGQAKG